MKLTPEEYCLIEKVLDYEIWQAENGFFGDRSQIKDANEYKLAIALVVKISSLLRSRVTD